MLKPLLDTLQQGQRQEGRQGPARMLSLASVAWATPRVASAAWAHHPSHPSRRPLRLEWLDRQLERLALRLERLALQLERPALQLQSQPCG